MSNTRCKTITGERTGRRIGSAAVASRTSWWRKETQYRNSINHLNRDSHNTTTFEGYIWRKLKTIDYFAAPAPAGLWGLKELCWLVGLTLWPPLLDLSLVSWTAHETASAWLNMPRFTIGAEDDKRPPELDGARNVCTRCRRFPAVVMTQWIQASGFVWLLLFCFCAVVANLCLGQSRYDQSLVVCLLRDIVSHSGRGKTWLFVRHKNACVCL